MNTFIDRAWDLLLDPIRSKADIAVNERFAHYTKADIAEEILDNQEIWLRRASDLDDATEVMVGNAIWRFTFASDPAGRELRQRLKAISPDLDPLSSAMMEEAQRELRDNTYVACFTQHPSRTSRQFAARHGRHDMHRDFGGPEGVALIFSSAPLLHNYNNPDAPAKTPLIATPMKYLSPEHPLDEATRMLEELRLAESKGALPSVDELAHFLPLWHLLTLMMLKHPTYEFEAEWRVAYSPFVSRQLGLPHVAGIKITERRIRGTTQPVAIVHLAQIAEETEFPGLGRVEFLDQVIVGKCAIPENVESGMKEAVKRLGFTDPDLRVIRSAHQWHRW